MWAVAIVFSFVGLGAVLAAGWLLRWLARYFMNLG